MAPSFKVPVECQAGHRGEPEPRAFMLGERRLEVRELLDRWLASAHRYYKVRVDDGQVFILRHDEATGEWEVAAFAGPGSPGFGPVPGDAATRH